MYQSARKPGLLNYQHSWTTNALILFTSYTIFVPPFFHYGTEGGKWDFPDVLLARYEDAQTQICFALAKWLLQVPSSSDLSPGAYV